MVDTSKIKPDGPLMGLVERLHDQLMNVADGLRSWSNDLANARHPEELWRPPFRFALQLEAALTSHAAEEGLRASRDQSPTDDGGDQCSLRSLATAMQQAFEEKLKDVRPCERCAGRGYHHGFGEDGNDPDWCDVCGGGGFDGPSDAEAWLAAAAVASERSEESSPRQVERESSRDEPSPHAAEVERLTAENERLRGALELAKLAIGDHFAPNDCYATGPLTGNPIADLVACPACNFLASLTQEQSHG